VRRGKSDLETRRVVLEVLVLDQQHGCNNVVKQLTVVTDDQEGAAVSA
jgi:hypothetical protein